MSSYLQLLDKRTQNDIKRLCGRNEGLTVDVFENHSGENVTTKETFKDVEKCAEFVYSYEGNLGTALSFNY